MDRKSQEEDKRIRAADPRHDKIKAELRPVDVPKDLLKRFVAVSAANTELNIETLGLLMGKPKGGKYVVTTLLIPRQQASSDWCSMEDEETVLEFQERRFLITLGWIHTHPSQSCFMSSVDLHTHAPYQKMLPESFAIVCAPKKEPNYGVFRLTDPPGLSFILDCTASSSFHPHSQDHLYTDCDGTHVTLVEGIGLEICDIRNSFIVA
ncbi:JAB1/MPN domain-containing protein [Sistotremastrum niveocremeum HHB9708]|uniref:JAB1/MPN domain-containing protein n=2 Tax=Sistotremastraceae TaxID=3402574 RepID=A0A164NSZ6_9AGAM|nr:JAB1/MPN domain-containing protein [Sistotremastrum niveocremeum HHB9708]KZT33751.1 JAB1/MPN domain-containing protein [Sistotremastrum suecicum HHB10207 ss-3]